MAGIGEATAIAATIQLGFSLAKTLVAVVGDYKSAREDIGNVATEVGATLNHAAELDAVVKNNASTRRLNDRGLKLAEKCKIDLTRIVEKLIRLLTKAGIPEHQPHTIEPEDIEVSKFGRASWIFLKPQITVIQRELNSVRLQILLVHTCIDAESAPSEKDRASASKKIEGLKRSRQLALRLVRDAQVQSDKAEEIARSNRGIDLQSAPGMSGVSSPPIRRSSIAMNGTRDVNGNYSYARADIVPQAQLPRHTVMNDSDTEQVAEEIRRELEQELLAKLERKVKEQEAIKAYDKRIRDEAVEGYKQGTRERLSTIKERSAETRQRLHATFTSELPVSEVEKFLDAQNQLELNDDFVELMIDNYKAPPLGPRHVQDVDTLSQHTESSRGSTKSWLSKIIPTRSRRSGSLYFGSAHSKEDLAPIHKTRYIHLQIVSHHDRPSLLPLDNSVFAHNPCHSVCDAQRTSTIWASLSPLCEALILDYLSRNCPLPQPSKWQLHSAWPVTQQLSRRGRYLQRALLGSQLLSWQGNFVVAFSAPCARPQSFGGQADADQDVARLAKAQPTAIDSFKVTAPSSGLEATKPQSIQRQSDRAALLGSPVGPMSQQPVENATIQVKPPTSPRSVAPERWPSQQHKVNGPQSGLHSSLLERPSWQLTHNPTSSYPHVPYSSIPYTAGFVPSVAPTSQTHNSLANPFSPPFGYPQSGSLIPYADPNLFSPHYQPSSDPPPMGMPYGSTPSYGGIPAQYAGSIQPPTYPTAASQRPAPAPPDVPMPSQSNSHKSKSKPKTKAKSSNSNRSRRYKFEDNTSSSSSSGPESIYPLRASEAPRNDSRRPDTSRSTVTFSTSLPGREARSATRKPNSRPIVKSGSYILLPPKPSTTSACSMGEGNSGDIPDEAVASDDDDDDSDDFATMVEEYMGSGRPAAPHQSSNSNDSDESWASISVHSVTAVEQGSDSSAVIPGSRRTRSAIVQEVTTSEDDKQIPE